MKSFKEHLNEYGGSVARDDKYDKDKVKSMLDAKLKEAEKGLRLAQKHLSQTKKQGMPILINIADKDLTRAKERVAEIKQAIKQL